MAVTPDPSADTETGSRPSQAPPGDSDPCPYDLVDCDVHPLMREGMASLKPFLSARGRRRLGLNDRRSLTTTGHREAVSIPRNMLFTNQAGVLRGDAGSPEGAAPGADPAHTASQLLDGCGIERAVLIGGEVLGLRAVLGGALVLAAMYLVERRPQAAAQVPAAPGREAAHASRP